MRDAATNTPDNATDQCADCGIPRAEASRNRIVRGRCSRCYSKHVKALKKSGAFHPIVRPTVEERFLSKVQKQANGCHHWTGVIHAATGYGTLGVDGQNPYAHRLAYTLFVGPIPDGMHIDHLCHNRDTECLGEALCLHRRCVNPDHLEPVTVQRNILRSPLSLAGKNARKTHCKRGHEFTPENTIVRSKGGRTCRACHNQHQRVADARRRAARREAKKAA